MARAAVRVPLQPRRRARRAAPPRTERGVGQDSSAKAPGKERGKDGASGAALNPGPARPAPLSPSSSRRGASPSGSAEGVLRHPGGAWGTRARLTTGGRASGLPLRAARAQPPSVGLLRAQVGGLGSRLRGLILPGRSKTDSCPSRVGGSPRRGGGGGQGGYLQPCLVLTT